MTRRALLAGLASSAALAQVPGERPTLNSDIRVLNPRGRVPVSIIVDDSTCLVNLNHFSIPQLARAWGYKRYFHDWRSMPQEIPDSFVRKFGEWAATHGVKGKYSIVPYPACVGRLDREIPGWSRPELEASIKLVQDLMVPNWDIHPEMVTHTRVIDLKTGHPYPESSPRYMENWDWTKGRSIDELAAYMRYALQILHNIDLPCEGLTTPGGFASQVLPELSQATLEACRDVYRAEIPHYFRHLYASGDKSVAPRVEYASGLGSEDPRCSVSIIGCTGDWTGGWDCSDRGDVDRFITADLSSGRMVDVIAREEPACMVCHWTGIHWNGQEIGFKIFQEVVRRLHERYDNLIWMKLAELSRYWAAKELTSIESVGNGAKLRAPFACPGFALEAHVRPRRDPVFRAGGRETRLERVNRTLDLRAGTWTQAGGALQLCFDLPRGASDLVWA